MTALQALIIGIAFLFFSGVILFLLILAKYYLTPTVGTFEINLDPEQDVDALYNIKFDEHPLTFKGKKTVRFNVVVREK